MLAKERQNIISELIKTKSAVTTAYLMEEFGISDETVRRDLLALEREGKLRRVHGGAVIPTEMKPFMSFQSRIQSAKTEKGLLSELAVQTINNGEIIGVDSGTTAVEFAEALLHSPLELTVVTHSLDVFSILSQSSNFRLILCGGHFLKDENAFHGMLTLETLKNLHVQKAFVFPSAVSLSQGICDFNPELAQVQRQLIESASEVMVLADSGKFEANALLKISDINSNFTFITDPNLPDALKQLYLENNIKIISSKGDLQ
ncbi:MAG: DeoR/GlpR transcriptional regulator [Clostridia bacterium]|nr:DeoR/GlpR transcriptional regulator [Clostridia bacterium]